MSCNVNKFDVNKFDVNKFDVNKIMQAAHGLVEQDQDRQDLDTIASFPGLHAQFLSLAVRKAGGRPGRIYQVMHAADVSMPTVLFRDCS